MAALATPAFAQTDVERGWGLIPTGLTTGDQFRLLFLSSTKRNGSATGIATYNTFIQERAAAGHTDIQSYSTGFRVVGCTADVDATANTSTTGTGVPIYWLDGTKVADDYTDFYDGSWDDEANDKNESGTDGPDTSVATNYPFTGCDDDGTEVFQNSLSRALGSTASVRVGRPNSSTTGDGPISGDSSLVTPTGTRPMYGLSEVFTVVDTTPPTLTRAIVNVAGFLIQLEFSENVQQANLPPVAAFEVTAGGSAVTVTDFVSGPNGRPEALWVLVSPVIRQGQAVVVAYEDPTAGNDTNAIQDTVGNDTPDFTTGRSGVPTVSNISTVTTTVPGAPTGLTATASGNTRINLSWTAPGSTGGSTITGYKIEVSPDDINNWTTLEADTRSTATTYPHTALAAGSIRYYRVSAINVVGAGTPSNIDNATTGTTGQTTVTFGASSYTAVEGGAAATVAVDLSVAPSAPVTIPLTTAAYLGNAAAADHSAIPANLMFTTGQTRRTFTVTATDDTYEDGGESVRLGFGTLPTGYAPGAHRTATVALADNDASLVVDFGTHFAHIVQVRESRDVQHQFSVHLSRWQHPINAKDPMTIPLVVTHVGDATAADYTEIPASVTIEVGKSAAAFSMRAIPDRTIESGEGLRIDFGALPGARKGRWGPYETVEFLDELTVSFGASSYTAAENGDPAMVEVKLGAVPSAVVTIPLVVTYQGGATAADHSVIPASVTFTTGQTQQTFMVTATADSDADSGEKLTIAFGRSLPGRLRPPAGGNCCATAEIEFMDHDPDSGKPTITGTPAAGETLTVDVSEIDDVDGLPAVTTYTYQWIRVVAGSESDIPGATLSTYTLQSEDEGNKVKVRVSFIDQGGTTETRTSEEYPSSGTINEEGETSPADVPAPPPFSLPTEEEITEEEVEEGCAVSDVTGDDQSLERFVECAAGRIEGSDTFWKTLRLLEEFRDDEGNWNDGSTHLVLLTARGGVYFHADNREVEDLDWSGILSCEGGGSVLDTQEGCFIEYEEERRGYAHPLSASHVPLARDEAEFVLLGGFDEIPEEGKPFTGMIGEPSTEAGDVDTDDRLREFVGEAGRVLGEAVSDPGIDPAELRGILRREEGPWRGGDVYIYILGETGRVIFDGADRDREQKNESGKRYVRDLIMEAMEAGEGIVEYTEGGSLRRGYAVRVEVLDAVYFVGSGYRVEGQPGGSGDGGCAVGGSDKGGAFGLFLAALTLLLAVSLKRRPARGPFWGNSR